MDGTERGRGQREGWWPEHPDRGADFHLTGGGVRLTEALLVDGPVRGCGTVHGAAGWRAAVCGPHRDEIRLVDVYGEERVVAGAVDEGEWGFALPSPDGRWLLAQWSGGCAPGVAYLVETSGGTQPVPVFGGSSVAVAWSRDGRAVVGVADRDGCSVPPEGAGTYVVDPDRGERQRLHRLPPVTQLTGLVAWRSNRLERVMSRALAERNLRDCCGQPSHGGGDAESGMVFEGHDVQVYAVPLEEFRGHPEGDPLDFTCGSDRYFLFDRGLSGSGDEGVPDRALVERAATMLEPMLYCTMGGDTQGPLTDEEILFAYQRRGSVWAVGRSGTRHRLTHGPGDSRPAVGPDQATVVFSRLNYDGVYDDLLAVDSRTGDHTLLDIAGITAFAADGRLAVAEPVDDDLADTAIAVVSGSRRAAWIPLGPQREVGAVTGLAWDADDGELLAVASGPEGHSFWQVDVADRSARRVPLEGADGADQWIIAPDPASGRFSAIRKEAGEAIWGELRVSSEGVEFDSWGVLPARSADGPALDPVQAAYLVPVGRVEIRRRPDGSFTFGPGSEDAWLIGDGTNLFLVERSGRLAHLLADVATASHPADPPLNTPQPWEPGSPCRSRRPPGNSFGGRPCDTFGPAPGPFPRLR